MQIDHLTIAGPDLSRLQSAFADAGMMADYGGPHSNGITHMALIGFDNGSYIEIVSTLTSGARVPLWENKYLSPEGGTAWTIEALDVPAALRAARIAGVNAVGPIAVKRHKPDGKVGQWDLGYLGNKQPGGMLPFLIHDFTPRDFRSSPSSSVAGKLRGLSHVVLAVEHLYAAVAELQGAFGLAVPTFTETPGFGRVAVFGGTPLILSNDTQHLAKFGESPCAVLLAAGDLERARRDFQLGEPAGFLDWNVCWLHADLPCQVGVYQPGNSNDRPL